MAVYIAFLRGINVSGHRVKMNRLRGLFEELGLSDVSTFIASGNVIFSSGSEDREALIEMLENHLAAELGYEVAVFLRTPTELASLAAADEPDEETAALAPSSHYVIFLKTTASESLKAELGALQSEMDEFEFSGTEIHWRIQGKLTDSPLFAGSLERATRNTPTTTRNMNTVRRIVERTLRQRAQE